MGDGRCNWAYLHLSFLLMMYVLVGLKGSCGTFPSIQLRNVASCEPDFLI